MSLEILVVDDDSVFRESVQRHLGNEYSYVLAETLEAARNALALSTPDCILLDFRLPDGEGTAIIPDLVNAGIPVIVCTARGSEALAVRALQVGADDYLAKSELKELDLRRAIDSATERARLRAEVREREAEKDQLIAQLQAALDDIETLRGLIPICAGCKKIRDDDGFWQGVEVYVSKHTQASFTHSYCPSCFQKEVEHLHELRESKDSDSS